MNNIFGFFIARGDSSDDMTRLAYASWFIQSIPIEEFKAEEKLFWKYIEYSERLNAPLHSRYFELWLHTELRAVLVDTQAHVTGCEALNYKDPLAFETAVKTTTQVMLDNFTQLETQSCPVSDFNIEAAVFFSTKKNERLTESLSEIYTKLNDTNDANYTTDYALDIMGNISAIYSSDKLEILGNGTNSKKMEFVTDCGIPAIDKDSEGLHTSQLLGIEAQPGTGKTRFAACSYCYRAAVLYKKDVLFVSLEQKPAEIEALWVAHHVFQKFGIQLTSKMIWKETYPEEFKAQVEAARFDLFHSGNYGKLIAVEETFHVRKFVSQLRNYDRLKGPFDLICIDYMGLMLGDGIKGRRDLDLGERIDEGYKAFKAYVRTFNKAGIAIGQFNREGISAGENDKTITVDMAQGGIAVYRHTDYNIAMSASAAMKLQHKIRFSQPKVRDSEGFGTFLANTRLGFGYFKQVTQEVV